MSYTWSAEYRRKVREFALRDVLDGMSMIGAAVLWDVPLAELEQLVDEARASAAAEVAQ